MADTPDANPDSLPSAEEEEAVKLRPALEDSPGTDGGTSGTGGTNHRGDRDITS